MFDRNMRLSDFFMKEPYGWLAHEKPFRVFQELSGKREPTIGDLAKMRMSELAAARGIGQTTLRSIVHFFETTGIKTRYSWSRKMLRKTLRELPHGTKYRPNQGGRL